VGAVSGQQVAALRASLMLDAPQAQAQRTRLTQSGDLHGFTELVDAAFLLAARRRFAPAWTRADIVRYVGSVRAHGPADDDIDPLAAEALILRALGTDQRPSADKEAIAAAQAVLLITLIADLQLDTAGLDRFLTQARGLADQWLSRPA
jgi:hypothetical protein